MKIEIFSENSKNLLFTLSDRIKFCQTDMFTIHRHPECELGFIVAGKGDYIIESEKLLACANSLFLVRPNEQHCVPTIFTDTLESFNFHLTPYYIWNVVGEYVNTHKLSGFFNANRQKLSKRIFYDFAEDVNKIMLLCQSKTEAYKNRAEIRKLTLGLIISIANLLPDDCENSLDCSNPSIHYKNIECAIEYICEHISEHITLDDIAKSAGLSRSHINVVFKNITGVPPYEYLLLKRIELALVKLCSSDDTVLSISVDCGFENLANFNRTFKRITGITPGAYRKLHFSF